MSRSSVKRRLKTPKATSPSRGPARPRPRDNGNRRRHVPRKMEWSGACSEAVSTKKRKHPRGTIQLVMTCADEGRAPLASGSAQLSFQRALGSSGAAPSRLLQRRPQQADCRRTLRSHGEQGRPTPDLERGTHRSWPASSSAQCSVALFALVCVGLRCAGTSSSSNQPLAGAPCQVCRFFGSFCGTLFSWGLVIVVVWKMFSGKSSLSFSTRCLEGGLGRV